MLDTKRSRISGKAISVRGHDIDTDRIIPARYLKCVTFDKLGDHVFEDDRILMREKGQVHPFDDPRFAEAEILLVNKNFGCGSSREHAPQALRRWNRGIKAIVGESFAEIFFSNCVSLGIPCCVVEEADIARLMEANAANPDLIVTVSIADCTVTWDDQSCRLTIPAEVRQQFLDGTWDMTFELLSAREAIMATAARLPYFNQWK
jgi:3-isopropylmalate/(R)-2-methylmalate dehydratase small subunit